MASTIQMPEHEEVEEVQQPRSPDTVVDWKQSDDEDDDDNGNDKKVILANSQSGCDGRATTGKTTFVANTKDGGSSSSVGTNENSTAFPGTDKQTASYAPFATNLPTNHHPSLGTRVDVPENLQNEQQQDGDAMTALTLLSSVATADVKDEKRNSKDQDDNNSNNGDMAASKRHATQEMDSATVYPSSKTHDVTRGIDGNRNPMEAEDSDAISALTMLATQAAPLAPPSLSKEDNANRKAEGHFGPDESKNSDVDHHAVLHRPFWSLTMEEEMKVMLLLDTTCDPNPGSTLLLDAAAKMTDKHYGTSCGLAGVQEDFFGTTQEETERQATSSLPADKCLIGPKTMSPTKKTKRKPAAASLISEGSCKPKTKKRKQNSSSTCGKPDASNSTTMDLPVKVSSSSPPPVSTLARGEEHCLSSFGSRRRVMEVVPFASHEASTSLATSALLSMAGGQQLPNMASTFSTDQGVSLVAASHAATVPLSVNTVPITPPPPPLPSIPQPPNQHHLANSHAPSTHFTTATPSEDWRKPPPIAPKMKRPHKKKDLGFPVEKEKRGGPIQVITRDEIRDQDVLAGRGGQSIHHCGNRIFRHLVNDKLAIYARSSKQEKTRLATSIVMVIKDRGGRFLRKIDASGRRRGRKRNSRMQVSDDDEDDDDDDFDSMDNFPSSSFPKKKTYRSSTDTMYEVLPWLKARYKVSQRFREALSHPNEGLEGGV